MTEPAETPPEEGARDFIRQIVHDDLESGRVSQVVTRFPPEPNGYLHIGHAKSICLNFGVAQEFARSVATAPCASTTPTRPRRRRSTSRRSRRTCAGSASTGAIICFASNYFDQLYAWGEHLIETGVAYVDDLSPEEMRDYRGTLTEPGRDSPYRDRPAAENLDLFRRMKAGEFPDGARVLRAKIDMAARQHQPARPGPLPHPARPPPPHR